MVDICQGAGSFCAILRASVFCTGCSGLSQPLPGRRQPTVRATNGICFAIRVSPANIQNLLRKEGAQSVQNRKSAGVAGGWPFARRSVGGGRVCPGSARPFPAVGISSSEGSSRAGGLLGPGFSSWPGLRASCCHPSVTRLLVLKRSFNLRDGPFQQHAYTHLKMAESIFFKEKLM